MKESCHYCGLTRAMGLRWNLTWDHVIPTSKGGTNTPANKVRACQWCNSRKGSLDYRDYLSRETYSPTGWFRKAGGITRVRRVPDAIKTPGRRDWHLSGDERLRRTSQAFREAEMSCRPKGIEDPWAHTHVAWEAP